MGRGLFFLVGGCPLVAALCLSSGCGGDGGDGAGSSASCDDFKAEYCAYGVDCALIGASAQECTDAVAGLPCVTDRLASDCATAFAEASCVEPPTSCGLPRVIDNMEAAAACDRFTDRLCTHLASCGESYELCLLDSQAQMPCESALELLGDVEPCLDAIDELPCSSGPPEVCMDLLRSL